VLLLSGGPPHPDSFKRWLGGAVTRTPLTEEEPPEERQENASDNDPLRLVDAVRVRTYRPSRNRAKDLET
jgi:hypothetical protein